MAKEILRFSPVAWQHINFIGKYEFYNRVDVLNIQEVIKKFSNCSLVTGNIFKKQVKIAEWILSSRNYPKSVTKTVHR
jgi:hypothetical protein